MGKRESSGDVTLRRWEQNYLEGEDSMRNTGNKKEGYGDDDYQELCPYI
jgi:hypothetical protein